MTRTSKIAATALVLALMLLMLVGNVCTMITCPIQGLILSPLMGWSGWSMGDTLGEIWTVEAK